MSEYRILIIGGGPAGLLTAQSLQKRGLKCTVFEQDAALDARSRDWNFGIYWAQSPLGDCLPDGWDTKLAEECQVDNHQPSSDDVMPILNSHTGELLKAVPTPNNLRLHRRNFLRLLRTNVDIRYGKRLTRMESDGSTATAYFEDGTSESGNLIVGAEGAHSKVRQYLLGEQEAQLEMSPIYASASMAKLPKEAALAFQKVHKRYMVCFNPEGHFLWVGVHDAYNGTEPGEWTFMIILSFLPKDPHDPSTLHGDAILADMKQRTKGYAEPFRTIITSIPEGTKCWHNQLSYWVPRQWDNRNSTVTLVGDAAHPMTFHRGQGFNNAILDAFSLAQHLSETGTTVPTRSDSAVTAYERELIERGKTAVQSSNENSLSVHDWNTLLKSPLFTTGLRRPDAKEKSTPNGTDVQKNGTDTLKNGAVVQRIGIDVPQSH